jgi:hypothetical protein
VILQLYSLLEKAVNYFKMKIYNTSDADAYEKTIMNKGFTSGEMFLLLDTLLGQILFARD